MDLEFVDEMAEVSTEAWARLGRMAEKRCELMGAVREIMNREDFGVGNISNKELK